MKIRFGYVAIALDVPDGSPNKTVTVKAVEKIANPEGRIGRLRRLTRENLATTLRILRYNAANQIHLYRFTSKTVPLATHSIAAGWDYIGEFYEEWREIGDYIRKHDMRVSAHPDHYTLLNSLQPEVLSTSLRDLDYHVTMLEAMGLAAEPQLVFHVGGVYGNKQSSLDRFTREFEQLPERVRSRLMLENDDKMYSAADVLRLCQKINCPMVLDIHHHAYLNQGEQLENLWPEIIATWGEHRPKIHISSPKNSKDFRSHADYVQVEDFLPFLQAAKVVDRDFDVMVEAKQKDLAMFRFIRELEKVPGVKRVEQATVEF